MEKFDFGDEMGGELVIFGLRGIGLSLLAVFRDSAIDKECSDNTQQKHTRPDQVIDIGAFLHVPKEVPCHKCVNKHESERQNP